MAIAVAPAGSFPANAIVPGARRRWVGIITLDNSYPTNGYTLTPASFGLTTIDAVVTNGCTKVGRLAVFIDSTVKLKVYDAVKTEVANATDLSADTISLEVLGY